MHYQEDIEQSLCCPPWLSKSTEHAKSMIQSGINSHSILIVLEIDETQNQYQTGGICKNNPKAHQFDKKSRFKKQ